MGIGMDKEVTWLDATSLDDEKDILSSELCTEEVFYSDLTIHSELFINLVTELTIKQE